MLAQTSTRRIVIVPLKQQPVLQICAVKFMFAQFVDYFQAMFILQLKNYLPLIQHTGSVPTKPIFFSESAICWSKGKYFWQYSKHSFRKLDKFVEI